MDVINIKNNCSKKYPFFFNSCTGYGQIVELEKRAFDDKNLSDPKLIPCGGIFYGSFYALPLGCRPVHNHFVGCSAGLFCTEQLLKNVKYRYMGLATMFAAAIYLFLVDLARIEVLYRVFALLVLAAVSIGLSFYYTRKHKDRPGETEAEI